MSLIENNPPKFKIKHPITNKDLWFRPFLVKEEKKMLMISELGKKEEIIHCVKEILEDCYSELNTNNLPTYVLDYLFNQVRIKSIGETISSKFVCPFTEELIDLKFSLEEIKIKQDPNFNNKIKIDENISIILRCPTYEDINSISSEDIEYDNIIELASRCLIKIYSKQESIDVESTEYEKSKDFFLNMTTKQFNKVISFFENIPSYEYEYNYTTSDGVNRAITISGIEDFFMFASAT